MIFYLSPKEKSMVLNHYQNYSVTHANINAEAVFKYQNLTITLFKNKVLFQGPASEIINEYRNYWFVFDEKEAFVIGNDEVGTGDYFGPIVITSCYIGPSMLEKLRQLGIKDSKQLDIKKIYEISNKLMKIVTFESVLINNRKYNQWINEGYNANVIKAWGHNQALVKMIQHKNQYKKIVIDQFASEKLYFQYLENMSANKNKVIRDRVEFHVRAEEQYLAVACSAIISRYLFLEEIKKISNEIKKPIPLGAGKEVDLFLITNKALFGNDIEKFLIRHSKYHFFNTKKFLNHENIKKVSENKL